MARVLVNTVSLSGGALVRERNLLGALATIDTPHECHVLWTVETRDVVGSLPPQFETELVPSPGSTAARLYWENTTLPRILDRVDPTYLYFPLHITNLQSTCTKISAIRNVAPFYPEAHEGAGLSERVRLRLLRLATKRTVRQSRRVVFMSHATLDRVASAIPEVREKAAVIPHGIPAGFRDVAPDATVREQYGIPPEFLLSVSNVVRYKNLVELVDGYAAARDVLPPLYLAGAVHDQQYASAVRERIRAQGLESDITLLGYVDHDDLPALYAACTGFVFSSACENAPVTLLEALAAGVPIATSDRASMPEFCGDAALYFDPDDPADIATTLRRLATDRTVRQELRDNARARSEDFSWERAAEQTSRLFSQFDGGDTE